MTRGAASWKFDTIRGLQPYEVDKRIRLTLEVIRRAVERLLLSHDNCMRSRLGGCGGNGYAYLPTGFVPLL